MYYDSLFSEKETSRRVRYKYCRELVIRRNSRISHGALDVGVKSHEVERGGGGLCILHVVRNQ